MGIICAIWAARRSKLSLPKDYRFLDFAFLRAGFFPLADFGLEEAFALRFAAFDLLFAESTLGLAFGSGFSAADFVFGAAGGEFGMAIGWEIGTGAFTLPFLPFTVLSGVPVTGGPAVAALAPRPRRGGGGGGGGGGANGLRNFDVSVRERNFPSSSSMNTSRAIFGYSGNCGVMRSSVISGSGIRCCT